jgi:hypothetical protein
LIASLILSGNFESVGEVLLPIVMQEKSKFSDAYTRFIETIYDQFDFASALSLTKELGKAASEDLLLKQFASEIQTQATLLIFQVKSKLYKTISVAEVMQETGIKTEEEVRTRIEENLKREGFSVEVAEGGQRLNVVGQAKD